MRIYLLTILIFMNECKADCQGIDRRREISYRLIKMNARSDGKVIARRQLANIGKCMDFAENKQALAFNFERSSVNDSLGFNCILLFCPEMSGTRALVNISGVDYYSSYSERVHSDTGNVTLSCVEKIGLFSVFHEMQNFTNARASCEKIGGILADVTTDNRNRGIATISGDQLMYVGLSNEGHHRSWKNEYGDQLSCYEYRAWDTGEPSHNRGCIAMIRGSSKIQPIWRVITCSTELPFICEIPRIRINKIQ